MKTKISSRGPTIEETELVGVPHYVQGEADGLCVYYALSMMLAALHPEWRLTMHDLPKYSTRGSPVFHGLRRFYPSDAAFKTKVADWFFQGMSMTEATKILNRYFQEKEGNEVAYFTRRRVRARRVHRLKWSRRQSTIDRTWTPNEVITSLSWHLPVIIAGGGLGAHAVVAIGYSLRGNADRFISYLDPGSLRVEWRAMGEIFTGDAEVITPEDNVFSKYRPGRVRRIDNKTTFDLWHEDRLTNPH